MELRGRLLLWEGRGKQWQPQHSRDDVPSAIILLVGGRGIVELFTYIGWWCVDFFLLPHRHSRLMCANPGERAPSSHEWNNGGGGACGWQRIRWIGSDLMTALLLLQEANNRGSEQIEKQNKLIFNYATGPNGRGRGGGVEAGGLLVFRFSEFSH